MRRFILPPLALAALGLSGCVEGEQTFTLNPDGSGKLRIDVVMAPPAEFVGGSPAKEPRTPEAARVQSLGTLLKAQGVVGWKDVTAGFAPDGRFKFAGTAYFDKLDKLDFPNLGPLLGTPFALTAADGKLVLAKKAPRGPGGPPTPDTPSLFGGPGRRTAEDLAKVTDADLDGYILGDRIQFQAGRPAFVMCFSKGRMKTTYLLPGPATETAGFQGGGAKLVRTLDGDKAVAGLDAFFAKSNADLRPVYRTAGGLEAAAATVMGAPPDEACKAVVAAPGAAQFDFAAEVTAARAAYPALRKALGVGETFWIPDGGPPPKGFGPPR